LSVKGLQLGGASRVNEVRINPMLNFEQILWNSCDTDLTSGSCFIISANPDVLRRSRRTQ
ncbi:hypothetical protein, partial [Cupriavidus sp. 8B]